MGDLAAILAQSGPLRDLAGDAPFLLNRADRATYVVTGAIDLFLVEIENGSPVGARRYCGSVDAGDLAFGVDGTAGVVEVGLLAVGAVGTKVADLPLEALRSLGRVPDHQPPLSSVIERWVALLSEIASRAIVPAPPIDAFVTPGARRRVQANQRVSVVQDVGWLTLPSGSPLFLDGQEVPVVEDSLFPLCPKSWISFGEDVEVVCRSSTSALQAGGLWEGLLALHDAVIEAAPLMLRLAAADEANRLRARVDADESAMAVGTTTLQEVVLVAKPRVPAAGAGNALFRACEAVGRAMGVAVAEPRRRAAGDQPPTLEEILRANGLRKRKIVLEDGWWRKDIGSFLLVGADGEAAAVLRAGGRYMIERPARGERRSLRMEAAGLVGVAYMFYEPLPDEPLTIRHVLSHVGRWGRSDLAAIGGFGVIGSLLALAPPIAVGYMVDNVIPDNDRPGLLEMALILLVVAVLQLVVTLALQRAVLRLEGVAGARLQAAVTDRLLRLPTRFFRAFTAGDLATRTLAVERVQAVLTGSIIGSLLTSVFALTSFGLMIYYSAVLGAAALAIAAGFAAAVTALGAVRLSRERDITRMRGRLSGELLEITTGIAKLRLAAAEQRIFGRWAASFAALERRVAGAKRVAIANDVLGAGVTTLAQALIFAVVVYGGLVEAGLGLGTLVAFLTAFNQALAGVARLSHTALELVAVRPILQHASPILLASPETAGGRLDPGILAGAIEVSHVTFRFGEGAPPVLSDFSLQVRAGEHVALVGPSGCGKSTVVRLLLGFESPERGAVLFDGRDLRGLDPRAIRRQMGIVLQNSRLVGSSVLDNILGSNSHLGEAQAWRAAEQAGLDDDIRAMPMGMQTVVSEATLSGGQLQRVAIARALIAEPRIVIFDEATSALDNRTQAIVTASLERMRATRIVVAHRLSTVAGADRIIVIKDGRVAESGRYDELMRTGKFFAKLVERQLPGSTEMPDRRGNWNDG